MGTRGPVSRNGARKRQSKKDGSGESHEFAQTLSQLTFEQFIESCGACGDLQSQDGVVVALLWQTIRTYARLDRELSDGPLFDQKDLLIQLAKLQVQIATLAARFAMDPATRIRLRIESPPNADDSEDSPFAERQRFIAALYERQNGTTERSE